MDPRQPPHDEDAERSVLGAALLSEDAAVLLSSADPADFYLPKHATIAQAMQTLSQAGEPLDTVLVCRELQRVGKLQSIGGPGYVAALCESVGTTVYTRRHLALIADLAQQRRLLSTLQRLTAEGFSGKHTTRAFLDLALKEVLGATHLRESSEPKRLSDVLAEEWKVLEAGPSTRHGYKTGLRELDAVLLPLEAKQLVLIAARPSAGKTSLVLHLVQEIARKGGNALFFSLETTKEKIARRALSQVSGVGVSNLTTGQLGPQDWDDLLAAAQSLHDLPVWIDDGYDLTGPRLRSKCRRMVAQHGPLGVIVIDYLQLLETQQRGETREREISEVSRGLKRLAKEFDCPILALSQLNRESEKRSDKAPSVADLRGSGQLEQDADVILLMQRTGDNETTITVTITVAKQKDGPTGEVKVRFDGATMRFGDLDNVVPFRRPAYVPAQEKASGDDE